MGYTLQSELDYQKNFPAFVIIKVNMCILAALICATIQGTDLNFLVDSTYFMYACMYVLMYEGIAIKDNFSIQLYIDLYLHYVHIYK